MNKLSAHANPGSGARDMVQVALFAALIVALAFLPFIGYIPLGFTKATTIHIPVIIGSILLGPKKGAFLGGVFGLTSLINNTLYPTATSFVFSPFYSAGAFKGGWASLVICFVPRILVGVTPWLVWRLLGPGLGKSRTGRLFSLGLAGFVGALTNTLLVMNGIFLFYGDTWAAAQNKAGQFVYGLILGVIGINGVPEAIVAGILTLCIGKVLLKKNVKERLGF